jgi:transposase-like protein
MRAISTDQRNQIISLLNSGQSVRKVSEKVGVLASVLYPTSVD